MGAQKYMDKDVHENKEERQIPEILPTLKNADRIKYLVTDADNNLWDWVKMHVSGMHKMACALSAVTGLPYVEIQASMKRVYKAAKTLDFSNLVESMDIIQAYAANKAESIMLPDMNDTLRARAAMQANIVAELTVVAKRAYDKNRSDNFALYPGIREVFEMLAKKRQDIKVIILTDAPHHKTIKRLKKFDLHPYVEKMFGQVQKPLRFDHEVEFDEEHKHLKPFFEAVRSIIPYQVNYSDRALVSSGDLTTPFQCVVLDETERKPDINLSRRLGLTPEEVREQVIVWGDNAEKDGGLAVNNGAAAYFYSDYGQTKDVDTIDRLKEFGSTQEVERNLSDGNKALERLKDEQEEDLKNQIQNSRTQIIELTHGIQVCDVLGAERPDEWKLVT